VILRSSPASTARGKNINRTEQGLAEPGGNPEVVLSLWPAAIGLPRSIVPPRVSTGSESLTLSEREEISRGLAAEVSLRAIAAGLGRPASTISREVGRHGGVRRYRAADAEARACDNALRPKTCLLARSPSLQAVVAAKLALDWSPQQISGWLALGTQPPQRLDRARRDTDGEDRDVVVDSVTEAG
jgi:hypothetical protein